MPAIAKGRQLQIMIDRDAHEALAYLGQALAWGCGPAWKGLKLDSESWVLACVSNVPETESECGWRLPQPAFLGNALSPRLTLVHTAMAPTTTPAAITSTGSSIAKPMPNAEDAIPVNSPTARA
jgi:hypothetical protein